MNKFNLKKITIIYSVLFALIGWIVYGWIYGEGNLIGNAVVIINKGNGSSVVASKLKDAGVINKAWLFKILARFMKLDKKLKAGEYIFETQISMYDVLTKLAKGDVIYRKITLPEGLTSAQMLKIIDNEKFLTGNITIDVKDGEMLPETYSFMYGDTKDSLILQAKNSMQTALEDAWKKRDSKLPIKSKNELLTLASIIEKETAVDTERGLVASVFVNRLIKGMRLQTDPTVIYALTLGKKELGRSLKKKDLKVNSPYNTYKHYGLPPSPICNPGILSLEAAANPEESPYLYFVADGKGGHNFSKSLQEHNDNIQNWLKERKIKRKAKIKKKTVEKQQK
ncbi:MAG: endolytic transglycosylase MltG [Alphaproteobacteria bacterium]|nr:endolytic transglycosylase MltG [Alphaproteobacteria bacterium]